MQTKRSPKTLAQKIQEQDGDDPELMNEKVVWLLGSGFSKPLGGPLFGELFDERTHNWVSAWLHSQGPNLNKVVELFSAGCVTKHWTNAEEFLEIVERYEDTTTQEVLRRVGQANAATYGTGNAWPFSEVFRDATQFVAAATSFFIDHSAPDAHGIWPEAWQPFALWTKLLTDSDHVITFNYDRVIETAHGGEWSKVSKLHGSVPEQTDLFNAFKQGAPITSIQIPGRGKVRASNGPLKTVWDTAAEKLNSADRLVVIGYSFPASDPYARSFILRHARSVERVTLVLGPVDSTDRVTKMFKRVLPEAKVNNTGLLAQEYLSEGVISPLSRNNHPNRFKHAPDADPAAI